MASNTTRPLEGTQTVRLLKLTGRVTLGASGALSATVPQTCKGFTIGARSAAGRYPIAFGTKLKELHACNVTVQITGTAAFAAGKSPGIAIIRDFNAAAGTATLQLLSVALADADAPDSAVLGISIEGPRGAA